jgi:hypothetical protein
MGPTTRKLDRSINDRSALPPKTDLRRQHVDVRNVSIADLTSGPLLIAFNAISNCFRDGYRIGFPVHLLIKGREIAIAKQILFVEEKS